VKKCLSPAILFANIIKLVSANIKIHVRKFMRTKSVKNSNKCVRKDCIRRHPKTCKHFSKEEGCNFKNDCAYLHDNDKNIHQDKINHAVAVVVTKHNNEIMVIQEELKKLKDTIETMKEKCVYLRKMHKKL
jgi:hypothetical protein